MNKFELVRGWLGRGARSLYSEIKLNKFEVPFPGKGGGVLVQ